jgi:glutamate racemase
MLRNIAMTARQASIQSGARPAGSKPASRRHAFRTCARPSGLPDQLSASRHTPLSWGMYGRRHYSRISDATNNTVGQAPARTLPDRQQVIDSIAHHRAPSPYAPRAVDFRQAAALYPESTQARVKSLDKLISESAPAAQRVPVRTEGTGNMLTAFDAVAAASKVFLCTGANTAEGKVELDGPVGTAVLAYALYQAGKVAIVVADRTNCRLVQEVLEKLDPDCARHLRYLHIHGVNGVLVDAMYKLLQRHQPQAVVHVGVAGRTRDGLYLDAHGAYIGEYNMALDQMMDLANALEKSTIAIGTGPHQAGLGSETDTAQRTLQAQHQILAGSVIHGALAVAELLAAAYAGGHACTPEVLRTMMKLARECRDKPEYKVRPVREGSGRANGKSPRPHQASDPVHGELADKALQYASLTGLARIQDSVHGTQIAWPQQIEEARLYGRTWRYVILVDSSAGGRLAALPFRNFFRARSSMDIKTLCLSDDAAAPYGTKPDEVRKDRVYRMLRHASRQGAEAIVMMCNTACLEDLKSMKQQIEAEAAAEGRKLVVQLIDLIETTAHAIVERGGARPVLLSTEATKKKNKYPEKILEFSQGNAEQPKVLVIAAGDDGNPELKHMDWPTLVNKGYHRKNQTAAVKAMVRREVRRYVEQIPLDSTSVWLVCTHFPALKALIDEILAERLREAGYTHKIPVYDPVADQADALIAWTVDFPPTDKTTFAHLPDFAVHTTAPVIDIIDSVAEILTPETVVTKVDFEERKPRGPSGPASGNPPDRERPATAPAQANATPQSIASLEIQELS